MRLSPKLAEALCKVIDSRVSPSPGTGLFLFGSRADDKKKGGDIDLLLIAGPGTKNQAQSLKTELQSALREAAGDQKVDLSIISPEDRASHPFFSSIPVLIPLKKW